jgi:hypothetical protein
MGSVGSLIRMTTHAAERTLSHLSQRSIIAWRTTLAIERMMG